MIPKTPPQRETKSPADTGRTQPTSGSSKVVSVSPSASRLAHLAWLGPLVGPAFDVTGLPKVLHGVILDYMSPADLDELQAGDPGHSPQMRDEFAQGIASTDLERMVASGALVKAETHLRQGRLNGGDVLVVQSGLAQGRIFLAILIDATRGPEVRAARTFAEAGRRGKSVDGLVTNLVLTSRDRVYVPGLQILPKTLSPEALAGLGDGIRVLKVKGGVAVPLPLGGVGTDGKTPAFEREAASGVKWVRDPMFSSRGPAPGPLAAREFARECWEWGEPAPGWRMLEIRIPGESQPRDVYASLSPSRAGGVDVVVSGPCIPMLEAAASSHAQAYAADAEGRKLENLLMWRYEL